MSKKWIGIIIYFLFLGIVTYGFALFSEADRVSYYLDNQKEELLENNLKLISAITVTNHHDNTQSYILAEPLYHEYFNEKNISGEVRFSVEVFIYTLVEFKGDTGNNNLAIVLKNLIIKDPGAIITNEINDLHATITFSENVQVGSSVKRSSIETFAAIFNNNDMRIIMFNYDKLPIDNSKAVDIENITISYPTEQNTNSTLVTLHNGNYNNTSKGTDSFDGNYNRDIKNVSYQNINIFETYQTNNYQNQDEIYFNDQILNQYNSYNPIIRFLGMELLFIIPLTYLLFFHKHVKIIVRNKRLVKKKFKETRYQEIKKEIYEDKETLGKKDKE